MSSPPERVTEGQANCSVIPNPNRLQPLPVAATLLSRPLPIVSSAMPAVDVQAESRIVFFVNSLYMQSLPANDRGPCQMPTFTACTSLDAEPVIYTKVSYRGAAP